MNSRVQLLKDLSIPCAEICNSHFENTKIWQKDDSSPVTEADLMVNNLIVDGISKLFPNDAILSEEMVDDGRRLDSEYTWIIDPIDGTSEFIAASSEFCVMICIIKNNLPFFAGITIPAENKAYFGGPEFTLKEFDLLSQKEKIIEFKTRKSKTLVISKSRTSKQMLSFAEFANLKTLRCGSAGVKTCRILQDKAAHYVHINKIAEWDTAAPDCLLRSVSSGLLDLNGRPLKYNKKSPYFDAFIFSIDEKIKQKAIDFFN